MKYGFCAMSPERLREVASAGGRKAHATKRAHQFTREERSRGGKASHEAPTQLAAADRTLPLFPDLDG